MTHELNDYHHSFMRVSIFDTSAITSISDQIEKRKRVFEFQFNERSAGSALIFEFARPTTELAIRQPTTRQYKCEPFSLALFLTVHLTPLKVPLNTT
jgi:hypothetical protein